MRNSVLGPVCQILKESGSSLRGFAVVALQHVQGSFVDLVDALLEMGVDPSCMITIPKAYSASDLAVMEVRSRGVSILDEPWIDYCSSYERHIDLQCLAALQAVLQWNKPILLIDEGGRLVRAASKVGAGRHNRFCAVEQTTRGHTLTASKPVSFPVVSVARSNFKRSIEADWIANSMYEGIVRALGLAGLCPKEVAWNIWGMGAIGSSLKVRLNVENIEPECLDLKDSGGMRRTPRLSARHDVNLWLAATGRRVVEYDALSELRGSWLLVNCGSSDIEFPAARIRCQTGYSERAIHDSVSIRLASARISLLNGGFPINFWGQEDTVPRAKFDCVRALMLIGALQANQEERPGLTPLVLNDRLEELINASSQS